MVVVFEETVIKIPAPYTPDMSGIFRFEVLVIGFEVFSEGLYRSKVSSPLYADKSGCIRMRQNFGLTEFNFTILCGKSKSGCEALMKKIIEDLRVLLKERAFRDEQHARFSLVGRICQTLGWDIWNPEEDLVVAFEYTDKRNGQ
jgi:hypothetical protein